MSQALYRNMFTNCQQTNFDRLRRKKMKIKDRLGKLAIYAGFIVACASISADAILYTAAASAVSLAIECFR
jgi:hypothetical protein